MAQLASIRQMSGQVSRGSAGEYQADERAGVARLSWPHQAATRQELEQRTVWWRLVLRAWRLPCQGAEAQAKYFSAPLFHRKVSCQG